MHIYFSGIGGAGIGPLAQIAHQAGYDVSGSDKQDSQYIHYLKKHGIEDIHIGQDYEAIAAVHAKQPIDWFVYTSALPLENPDAPELQFCADQNIKTSKRDEFLNLILKEKKQKLIAVAGTQGKTTTTALFVWLFKQLGLPVSYILPAKTDFADLGEFDVRSEFFVYEADEFDRNFLAYEPYVSIITGVSWDHHEIFPTREDYNQAFQQFINQSHFTVLWHDDMHALALTPGPKFSIPFGGEVEPLELDEILEAGTGLSGKYNRQDAALVIETMAELGLSNHAESMALLKKFPGLSRRMEEIKENLYTDYAHTPDKIRGAMSVATEMAAEKNQNVVVVYEPLTNRRQHFMIDDYGNCFNGASHVYWIPSYLAREDPEQRTIPPAELISHLADPSIAEPMARDGHLKEAIEKHLANGDMVIGMAGGGGDSLDDWLRAQFT